MSYRLPAHKVNLRIRPYEHHAKYYETDQMGIIHHSNYVKWMERSET